MYNDVTLCSHVASVLDFDLQDVLHKINHHQRPRSKYMFLGHNVYKLSNKSCSINILLRYFSSDFHSTFNQSMNFSILTSDIDMKQSNYRSCQMIRQVVYFHIKMLFMILSSNYGLTFCTKP